MQKEVNFLYKNSAWTLTQSPEGQKVIDSKWVFKVKNTEGKVTRFKARLVAKDFSQKKGKDYEDTFSPVVRHSTLKTLIALAVELDLTIEHMDVKTAFLNGDLLETIYMTQPEGFVRENKDHLVCKLNKAIYGLKQALRMWYDKITTTLISLNFKQLDCESCVFVIKDDRTLIIIFLHVDDLLLFSNNEK